MAGWALYDYVDARGINQIERWTKNLESGYRGMLNRKLRALQDDDERGLVPGLIEGPIKHHRHIYKLKAGGKVRLRPLLCKGPVDNDSELTLLIGATERDYVFDPPDAPDRADIRRGEIINDNRRRCSHVRV